MANITQMLRARDDAAATETRRGTVVSDLKTVNFNLAAQDTTVFVVDVDIGASKPVKDVIVSSSSGLGGRAFAKRGKAIEIQRSQGGRWFAVRAGDRIRRTGITVELDEDTDTFDAPFADGFTFDVRPYSYYEDNEAYGVEGYGNTVIVDANGDEVDL